MNVQNAHWGAVPPPLGTTDFKLTKLVFYGTYVHYYLDWKNLQLSHSIAAAAIMEQNIAVKPSAHAGNVAYKTTQEKWKSSRLVHKKALLVVNTAAQ